jgi:hypothetical protein
MITWIGRESELIERASAYGGQHAPVSWVRAAGIPVLKPGNITL